MSSRFDVDSSSDSEGEVSTSQTLPTEPPFLAYISNLKPEVTEKDVRDFFDEYEIASLRLKEGKGTVEFKDRETLVRALFYSGRLLLGLEVKMEVRPNKNKAAAASATAGGDNAAAGEGASARGGRGGGRGGRGGGERGGRGGGRGGEGFRGGGRGTGTFRARRNSDAGEEGGGGNPAEEKKERPRLQLKPRSKPLEAKAEEDVSARKPSIFGGGKPHDELEWTKKQHHKEEPPIEEKHYSIRGDRTKARSGSFSGEKEAGGGTRPRSGSIGRGGAAAGGRGAGPSKPKPSKPKVVVGEDGWVEAVGDGKSAPPRQLDQEEREEDAGRAVGGAFAALNMDSDSD